MQWSACRAPKACSAPMVSPSRARPPATQVSHLSACSPKASGLLIGHCHPGSLQVKAAICLRLPGSLFSTDTLRCDRTPPAALRVQREASASTELRTAAKPPAIQVSLLSGSFLGIGDGPVAGFRMSGRNFAP
eukprot:1224481-Rhodomonas_salina.4